MNRETLETVAAIWVIGGMLVTVGGMFYLLEHKGVNMHNGRVASAAAVTMWLLAPLTATALLLLSLHFVAMGFVEGYRLVRPAKPELPKATARKAA